MNINDVTQVFYVPGQPRTLDAVHPETGKGIYGGKTLAETQAEDPGAIIGTMEEAIANNDAYWIKDPEPITMEEFDEMLNCLPPRDWEFGEGYSVFKMSELTSGNMTQMFGRIGECDDPKASYFAMTQDVHMPVGMVLGKFQQAAKQAVEESK